VTARQRAEGPLGYVPGLLSDARVRWCWLRPSRDGDDDHDLLVHPDDVARALLVLSEAGFVEEPAFGRGTHRFLIGYDGRGFSRVDIVSALDFGPFQGWRSGMAAECLDRRTVHDGVPTLAPPDEFWATVLHLLGDDGADVTDPVRLDRVRLLAEVYRTQATASPWVPVVASLLPPGLDPEGLVTMMSSPVTTSAELEELRRAVRGRALRSAWRSSGGRERLVRTLWMRGTERPRQWRGRRGLLVAVMGPDGAGKSTLLSAMGAVWPWPHERIYLGLWPDTASSSRLAPYLWPVRRPVRAFTRYLRGALAASRGRLVLFDRYVYDAAVPPRGSHQKLKRLYFRLLMRSAPAPDLVVLLDAPGEVLFARKREMTPELLDADRTELTAHLERVSCRPGGPSVVVLDATRSREAVTTAAVESVWSLAVRRLRNEGGGR
jgi:thymidylate kinase